MNQRKILSRLPLHVEAPGAPVERLVARGRVFAVITEGERGANLYPGPRH